MHASRLRPPLAALLCLFATSFSAIAQNTAASFRAVHGPQTTAAEKAPVLLRHPKPGPDLRSWFLHWNEVAINASGLDHTQVEAGEIRVFGEQLGPGRSARAMAIVHIAMFDAMIAVEGGYRSYTHLPRTFGDVSIRAAIAQAAHDALVALYPSQADAFDAKLKESKGELTDSPRARIAGILLGKIAAAAILRQRRDDGAQHTEPVLGTDHTTSNAAGHWRQDPISRVPVALGAHWDDVEPFVIRSAAQFRVPPPPAMTSAEYGEAFDEVKRLGGDGVTTPTVRTADQTFAGIYWAYDGTPGLGAPPRLYNQIAVTIATQQNTDAMRTGAPARAGERGDGRRRHRHLGVEVRLRFLAADHRHPRVRSRAPVPPARRRQSGHDRRSHVHAARGAGEQPRGTRTSHRRSQPTRQATRVSAARSFRLCATSIGPTTSPSPSSPTNSTESRATNDGTVRPLKPRTFPNFRSRGRERAEPHLPRHPLGVRQDRRH